MSITDIVGLIANVSLAISVVVAVIFGIAQVRAASRDRKERLTLETLRNFQSREFSELIHYITTREMPRTQRELDEQNADDRIRFIQYSMMMESLGILVAENYVDLDLVDKTLGSFVISTFKKYKPVFLDQRKSSDPYAGEYFQWLATRMAKSLKDEHHRRPVFEAETNTETIPRP